MWEGIGEREREIDGVETGGGDGSEMESLMEVERKLKIDDRYRCQPHPGLRG